jgi:amino acid adenylation domain-containing protein
LVDALNDVRAPYPDAPTVDELVLQTATRTPDAVAVVDGAARVSYADLVERAQAVADRLRTAGCRPGEAVAVMFPRGVDCVASMLGVLLVGAVYVPMAVAEPEVRRERLLDLLAIRFLLRASPAAGVELTERDAEGLVLLGDHPDDPGTSPLYVMFTSGSTGEPKAVVVSHRSVIRLVCDPWFVDFRADDGVGFASNPGFDAATWEVWGALVHGARLVTVDGDVATNTEALDAQLATRDISLLFLTTSLFNAHARIAPAMFGPLRILSIGGEAADPRMCRRVLESAAPPTALLNAYGPTESTTFASWYRITAVPDGALRLPIGTPIANTTLHVLDRHGRLVPPGVPGELFIGGDGLAVCYFGDPELTARKFVADPFAGPPHRLYATGDLVVRAESGEVVFLRRIDDQLKIRGHRVEPLEVAAAIEALDGVSAAVVLPRADEGYTRLVAYVVADSAALDASSIRSQLRVDLPAYLVPSQVVLVDELPLTKSGKLDRARLPDPFVAPDSGDGASDGATAKRPDADARLTETLTGIWSQVLGVRDVDPEQTFFDAGGDSLLAVRLYGAVQRRFGVVLPSGTIDQHFTVAKFEEAVRAALERAAPPLVTEMTTSDGPLVVFAPPGGGDIDDYRWLAAALEDACHVVGVREPGHYGTEPRPQTVADVSATCRWALQNAGFDSPVAIGGYCAGGVLAHQMACDLAAAGHQVDLVVLLDTPIPGAVDDDDDEAEPVGKLVDTVRRRGRNAVALARMQTQRSWYRARQQPMPPPLAHAMTVRSNARRIRAANPSFFDGHVLFVQAVDDEGVTQTEGAPEYWSQRARSITVTTTAGSHEGPDSFLARQDAGATAEAIVRELDVIRTSSPE